ncbi:MAG: hypothetical protein R2911_35830 [Caldilineaceae bacterium]
MTRTGRARKRPSTADCLAYNTIDELIADDAVELVVVATPSQFHVPDATAAMRHKASTSSSKKPMTPHAGQGG